MECFNLVSIFLTDDFLSMLVYSNIQVITLRGQDTLYTLKHTLKVKNNFEGKCLFLLFFQAVLRKPVEGEERTPVSDWVGLGFSSSMPAEAILKVKSLNTVYKTSSTAVSIGHQFFRILFSLGGIYLIILKYIDKGRIQV